MLFKGLLALETATVCSHGHEISEVVQVAQVPQIARRLCWDHMPRRLIVSDAVECQNFVHQHLQTGFLVVG